MSPELIAFLGAAVGTLGGVVMAWISQRGTAGKIKADAADTLTDTAVGLLTPLKAEIKELRDNQRKLIIETGELRKVIGEKEAMLVSLKADNERLERRVMLLENLLVTKEADILSLKARVLLLEGVIADKDKSITDRDVKIANLETKVCQLESEVQALRAQLPDWKPGDTDRRTT